MSTHLPKAHKGRVTAQSIRDANKAESNKASFDAEFRGSPSVDSEYFLSDTSRFSPFSKDDVDRPSSPRKKVRAGSNGPIAPAPSRRFWPKDTRGLLELCEQGYQVQMGMKTHCQETSDALQNMAGSCVSTIRGMLTRLEEAIAIIQSEAEKPANVDWGPIFREISEKVQPSIVSDILELQETSAVRLEGQLSQEIAQAAEKLRGMIENRSEAQKEEVHGLRQEIREVQRGASDFEEVTQRSHEQMLKLFGEQQLSLQAFVKETVREVLDRVDDQSKQLASIEQVEGRLNQQLTASRAADMQHHGQIKDNHKHLVDDFNQLFGEIGMIQKSMHIPYRPAHKSAMLDVHRMRDYQTQTDDSNSCEACTQTDQEVAVVQLNKSQSSRKKKKEEKKKLNPTKAQVVGQPTSNEKAAPTTNVLLADDATKKKRMREQLIKPKYNVADFYHKRGCAQRVARNPYFENTTFFVILTNAMWIAVDTDHNDATLVVDASFIFQLVENIFCAYFSFELLVRFLAFRRKVWCFKDFWFVFDFLLVVGMIAETWVVTAIILILGVRTESAGGVGDLSMLRMVRLVKICRMARMARLLRSVPELVMIVKGMGVAFRSVSFFALLALIIIYIFAICLRQLTIDTDVGDEHFRTVPQAMAYLLLEGMLPIYAPIVNSVSDGKPYLWPVMLFYILLASVTVLNMLVGVLTEVVRTVAASEKEAMTVTHVTHQLRTVMGQFQNTEEEMEQRRSARRKSFITRMASSENIKIRDKVSKQDFEEFLMKPDVMKIIQEVGVDVFSLCEMSDLIYEDKDKDGTGLSFVDFIDVVLNQRGANPATVKDVKEMQRIVMNSVVELRTQLNKQLVKELGDMRHELITELHNIKPADSDSEGSNHSASSRTSRISAFSRSGTLSKFGQHRNKYKQAPEGGIASIDSIRESDRGDNSDLVADIDNWSDDSW